MSKETKKLIDEIVERLDDMMDDVFILAKYRDYNSSIMPEIIYVHNGKAYAIYLRDLKTIGDKYIYDKLKRAKIEIKMRNDIIELIGD
jgi:hypothetical protein